MSLHPTTLDEYPIHQAPLPIARPDTSDRNFYDRCYFNAMDRAGEVMMVAGAGVYPNLGVQDGFLVVRVGDVQHAARFSTALGDRPLTHEVVTGGGRIGVAVPEPLQTVELRCEADGLAADLTWRGSFPAILEQPHLLLGPSRPTLMAQRFAQLGTWAGSITVGDRRIDVTPAVWHGTRDRSWGIRPVGDADPAGRDADSPLEGFWWLYCPMQFDEFALVVIVQEEPNGFRTLNDAVRIFPDGRVEQLGWPRVELDYVSGSRHPLGARLHLTTADGTALVVEVETVTSVALHLGGGYGGDPEWTHGQWRGVEWSQVSSYDLSDPDTAARLPWGVTDHSARAVLRTPGERDREGRGLFEHASMGRHDPTGFGDWMAVAR
ncbi:hypothetical protein [Nocardioides terrisoli]|uniref:hypothetical protein n=1 Tax=Nocardioides terrisoli TaxID=3388267 RepID=UPI00287B9645|nr:hypothetical protein [Nocardioides marmorisolisilvae]